MTKITKYYIFWINWWVAIINMLLLFRFAGPTPPQNELDAIIAGIQVLLFIPIFIIHFRVEAFYLYKFNRDD